MIRYANRGIRSPLPSLSIGRTRSEEFNAIVLAQATGEVMEIVDEAPWEDAPPEVMEVD